MRESNLLAHIARRSADLSDLFPQVVVGPGHDCAVVRAGGCDILLKADQVVEGRHFLPSTPIGLIARKAIARPLSDLAAAAGTPLAALAAAQLPPDYPHADDLFDALASHARAFGCPLVGGDIAAGAGPLLSLSITVVGLPHPSRGPVLRSGARPGDRVYVTGALGNSFGDGFGKHLSFTPRLAEARALADALGQNLHAMMDISDGVGLDTDRLARASGVAIDLTLEHLPVSPGATPNGALRDGEDYELLFAAAGPLPPLGPGFTTPITRIGTVLPGEGAFVLTSDGRRTPASALGWNPGVRSAPNP